MKEILYSNNFKKDLRKVEKYSSFKKDKLKSFVEKLAAGESLPASAKNHKLAPSSPKKYSGMYDFHIAPDIVVIYKNDDSAIILVRIGKHNQLGLTEDL